MAKKHGIGTENLKVIILSFIVAATFWVFKALNKSNYSATINYPITFIYDQQNVIVTKPLPDYVRLDVSGGGWNLLRKTFTLSADPINIRLSNPTEIKAITRVSLLPEVVNQLKNINVNQILTDTLHISIEPLITVKVPVVLDTARYSLASGYVQVRAVSMVPDSITLSGPLSILDTIQNQRITLDRQNIEESQEETLDVITVNEKLVTSDVSEVEIYFPVDKLITKEVDIRLIPDNFPNEIDAAMLTQLLDSTIRVKYEVPEFAVDSVQPYFFDFYLPIDRNETDSVKILVRKVPNHIYSYTLSPEFIRLSE